MDGGQAAVDRLWSQVFGPTTRICETIERRPSADSNLSLATTSAYAYGEVVDVPGKCGGGSTYDGSSWARHSLQTRAIALALARAGLLAPQPTNTKAAGVLTTVEFGAACEATLSEQVRTVAGPQVPMRQVLVDRIAIGSAHRYAGAAGHERRGGNSDSESCERLTVEIAELDLPAALGATRPADVVVGMAKHLCGPGCDAALAAMISVSEIHPGQLGVAVVGCCYGSCDWKSCCRTTQDFFVSHGLDEAGFQLICKAAGNMAVILHRITAAATEAAAEVAMVLGAVDTVAIAMQADRAAAIAIAEAMDTALGGFGTIHATEDSAQADAAMPQYPANALSDPDLVEIVEIALAAARQVALLEAGALRMAVRAKRLMDEGRRRALEHAGFQAKVLGEIVPHVISVENTLLLALRPPVPNR
eukprot:COSAG02_NODE_9227_length_2283_cov_2.083333_1_plen_419_part_00